MEVKGAQGIKMETFEEEMKYVLDTIQSILKRIEEKDDYRKINEDILKLPHKFLFRMDSYVSARSCSGNFGRFTYTADQMYDIKKMFAKVKEFEEIFKDSVDEKMKKAVLEKLVYENELKF